MFDEAGSSLLVGTATGATLLRRSGCWSAQAITVEPDTGAVAAGPDGALLAAGSRRISVLSGENGRVALALPSPDPIRQAGFADGGRMVYGIDEGNVLRLWPTRTEEIVADACARWPPHLEVSVDPSLREDVRREAACGPAAAGR